MKKKKFEDDGRTIANMDFEHMTRPGVSLPRPKKSSTANQFNNITLTKKERRAMILGGMLAILPIVIAFGALYFLALLFLDLFWLR